MFESASVLRRNRLVFQCTILAALVLLSSCRREDRELGSAPPQSADTGVVALTTIAPGPSGPVRQPSETGEKYSKNAFAISQGKELFSHFNCTGCHGNGGGASGPALMDDTWIYGGQIENIAATIREGRPNGMPSFRGRVTEDQIWQLAAYVHSMSGNAPAAARSSRSDQIYPGTAEDQRKTPPPINSGTPTSAVQPQ